MSFKYFLFLFTLLFTACGVKGPPIAPPGTSVPSFVEPYMKKTAPAKMNNDEEDNKKKSSDKSKK